VSEEIKRWDIGVRMREGSNPWNEYPVPTEYESATGGYVRYHDHAAAIAAKDAEIARLRADKWALFAALGYPVPREASERLSSGELPVNGIAVALNAENERLRSAACTKYGKHCSCPDDEPWEAGA